MFPFCSRLYNNNSKKEKDVESEESNGELASAVSLLQDPDRAEPVTQKIDPPPQVLGDQGLTKHFKELSKALTICIAFAANAGGTGTLIGTPVNLVLKGQADE